jgi:hypothetical protein
MTAWIVNPHNRDTGALGVCERLEEGIGRRQALREGGRVWVLAKHIDVDVGEHGGISGRVAADVDLHHGAIRQGAAVFNDPRQLPASFSSLGPTNENNPGGFESDLDRRHRSSGKPSPFTLKFFNHRHAQARHFSQFFLRDS